MADASVLGFIGSIILDFLRSKSMQASELTLTSELEAMLLKQLVFMAAPRRVLEIGMFVALITLERSELLYEAIVRSPKLRGLSDSSVSSQKLGVSNSVGAVRHALQQPHSAQGAGRNRAGGRDARRGRN